MSLFNNDEILEKQELLRIIKRLKNMPITEKFQQLLVQIEDILENNTMELDECENSFIRFCDYSSDSLHGIEMIDYFEREYKGSDKENSLKLFVLYSIIKNASAVLDFCDNCISTEEEYREVDECFSDTFKDLSVLIEEYQKSKTRELDSMLSDEINNLSFLTANRFKVFFAGNIVYDDIKGLPKHVKKALLVKIQNELSKERIVPSTEIIRSIKEEHGVSMFRTHLADDYRLVFMREKGTTIILGVSTKSGKDEDYTRFTHIASQIKSIRNKRSNLSLVEEFGDTVNNEVVKLLEEYLKAEKTNQSTI